MRIRSVALRTNNITGNIKLRMKTNFEESLECIAPFQDGDC